MAAMVSSSPSFKTVRRWMSSNKYVLTSSKFSQCFNNLSTPMLITATDRMLMHIQYYKNENSRKNGHANGPEIFTTDGRV